MFDRDLKMRLKTFHSFVDGIIKTENHLSILAVDIIDDKIDSFIYSFNLFFKFVTLPMEIPDKQSFTRAKQCYTPWKVQVQKTRPVGIPHDFF